MNDKGRKPEIPDGAVLVAVVLAAVAVVATLYDSITNMENLYVLFGVEELTRPATLLALVCVTAALLTLFIGKIIAGAHPLRDVQEKVAGNYKSLHDIKVCADLHEWESEINTMCQELKIKGAKIDMDFDPKKNAAARAYILKGHEICFGYEYFSGLKSYFSSDAFYDVILLVLGHELAHLKALDSYGAKNRKLLTLPIIAIFAPSITIAALKMFGLSDAVFSSGFILVVMLVYYIFLAFCLMTVGDAWGDFRWQGQVNELRADRTGLQVSGVEIFVFEKLAECHQKQEFNEKSSTFTTTFDRKLGWLEKLERILNGEPLPDLHPSWEVRVQEIRKYGDKKWSLRDDIRYGFWFIRNLKVRKDWRL